MKYFYGTNCAKNIFILLVFIQNICTFATRFEKVLN